MDDFGPRRPRPEPEDWRADEQDWEEWDEEPEDDLTDISGVSMEDEDWDNA